MNITLKINGVDFSKMLSTWETEKERSVEKTVKTIDQTEVDFGTAWRTIITFSMLPFTDAESNQYYKALSAASVSVTFTDSDGQEKTGDFRVACDLRSIFLLDSVDGFRRYRGGRITLRQKGVTYAV